MSWLRTARHWVSRSDGPADAPGRRRPGAEICVSLAGPGETTRHVAGESPDMTLSQGPRGAPTTPDRGRLGELGPHVLEGGAPQPGNVHLGDAQPLGDLGLGE